MLYMLTCIQNERANRIEATKNRGEKRKTEKILCGWYQRALHFQRQDSILDNLIKNDEKQYERLLPHSFLFRVLWLRRYVLGRSPGYSVMASSKM